MPNNFLDTTILDKAILFAIKAHANTERRGVGIPYSIHLLEAVEIVATMTKDQEIMAAAALHDTVEDTEVSIDEIRATFGERVASLVQLESEKRTPGADERASWRSRKEQAILTLSQAPYEAKMVALGDKLSNIRAIARDYRSLGDQLWSRFHAPNGKADHEWHYRSLANALFDLAGFDAYKEFLSLLDQTFGPRDLSIPYPINLEDYERSGEGFCAVSYNHKNGHTMIKLYDPQIPVHDSIQELSRANEVYRMGLPTPLPGRLVTDGQRYGVEFERIVTKKSFSRSIADNTERLPFFATRFAQLCKQLHATPCNTQFFDSQTRYFEDIINRVDFLTPQEKQHFHAFLQQLPEEHTCLHGDLHIGNVITTGNQDLWIDLGDFRWGNHLYDMGMFYLMCNTIPEPLVDYIFHLRKEQMQQVWNCFVKEYFDCTTPEEVAKVEQSIIPFAALRAVNLASMKGMEPFLRQVINQFLAQ